MVFNFIYLIDIFAEFYHEYFAKRNKVGQPIKYLPKDLLTYVLWGKNNNKESCCELEYWHEIR